MVSTIDEARTPSELAEWLRVWANGYEDGDALDDNDARQIADAVVRVCAPCNAAVTREALMKAKLYFDHRGEGTNLDDAGMAIDAITSIDAALAAPARNCDRFDCVCTAQREFRRAFRDPYSNPAPSGDDPAYWPLVVNWLFAPAEGGAK